MPAILKSTLDFTYKALGRLRGEDEVVESQPRQDWWNDRDLGDPAHINDLENKWILEKMQLLQLDSSGVDETGKLAWMRFKSGRIFYNFLPSQPQRQMFRQRRDAFPAELKEDAVNVAWDFVLRYMRENVGAWIPAMTYHLAHLGPDCAFIDAGAYIGFAAMRVANTASNVKVIGIEAEQASYEVMKRNVEENGLEKQILPVHAALSDEDGTVTLKVDPNEGNRQGNIMLDDMADDYTGYEYDLGDSRYQTVDIPARKLDTLLPELDFVSADHPFMVHLGINGAEYMALQGMRRTLREAPRYGVKVSTRYFDPKVGPIHDKVIGLLSAVEGTGVIDLKPHVYAYRW